MDQTKNIERNEVTEGHATIYTPKAVFYNPVQEFNRDLTIAVISLQARQHFQAHNNKLKLREAISHEEVMVIWDYNIFKCHICKLYNNGLL